MDNLLHVCHVTIKILEGSEVPVTPFEKIFSKKPTIHHVHCFGCPVVFKIGDKLERNTNHELYTHNIIQPTQPAGPYTGKFMSIVI